ncbi:MAG: LpxL/LpxP family Kdo(2)-lipid IV(A) lauroyl/palmitoleoyl acyltransferase [Proteobacteria bacterium]|nr:LpxL/LpxP family Kdo(2)-lipid IV(A) lauroyl/palmitoleoyl acyltransferase [Pseudomonadota bacterium]
MQLPPRPSFAPRHWIGWLGIGIGWLAGQLPWPLQRALGGGIGRLAYFFARSRRRAARINLALCFPELDAAARKQLLREHFAALGIGLFEFARAWWGSIATLRRTVRIEGLEHLCDAVAQGRGVLLVSGHFLNLEICGRLLCDHVPLAGMYRRHAGAVLEWAVLRGRLRYAAAMFQQHELRGAIRHLKSGGVLWYAPDQDMHGKDTAFAPFFGIPAASITATHQLARVSGCSVLPFFHHREHNRYVLRIAPPLADFPSSDAAADTARVNAQIEAMVRQAPAQYLWIHRRFKRRPQGEPAVY